MNKNYKRGQLKPSEHTGYVSNTVDSQYFLLVTSAGYVDDNGDSSDGTGQGFLLLNRTDLELFLAHLLPIG